MSKHARVIAGGNWPAEVAFDWLCVLDSGITGESPMPKAPMIRVRLADETSLDLPENELVQVVTHGPSETQEEGFVRLNPKERKKAIYGKLSRVRAAALAQGQHIVTYRGILQIEGARRV